MGKKIDDLDFHLERGDPFTLSGRRYRVSVFGTQTLKQLLELYDQYRHRSDRNWAVKARPLIREIQSTRQPSVLTLVVERTTDPALRIFAIWLRGRCRGTLGTKIVARFRNDPDFYTRKETARSLKRMSAWSILSKMAESDKHERIRRIATSRTSRPISSRITDFTFHLSRLPLSTKKKRFYVASGYDMTQSKPPKSVARIRAILQRIHGLVSRQGS